MPTLYDYQIDLVRWLRERETALLAADMGTGKTPTSIRACDSLLAQNVLIVCPAVACTNWMREIRRWSPGRDPIHLSHPIADATLLQQDTAVISYDRLVRGPILDKLMQRRWDVLILDEAHYLKGFSKRTRAVYGRRYDGDGGLVSSAERVWLLTGTPMPNHPGELWTHLRALYSHENWKTHQGFVDRYCTTRIAPFSPRPIITGGKNLDDLRKRIEPWMRRVRKVDVLKDLPALTIDILPMDVDTAARALRDFEQGREGRDLMRVLEGDLMDLVAFATLRRLTGTAKAAGVIKWLEAELDGGLEKVVVFAHHRDVIDAIARGLQDYGVVVLSGETSARERQWTIDTFNEDPKVRVFVGQLQSASTAISLTAASDIVFAEADWTPATNAQAIARCHRHGQTKPVVARFITLADSIDELVMRAVVRKTATITEMGLD